MVDYPILRFVAGVGETEPVLDLNDGVVWETLHEGFTLGAATLDVDPLATATPWGERTVSWTSRVVGGSAAAYPALTALSVETLRWRNWLLFQFDAESSPFWLRTYPSAPGALSFEDVFVDDDGSEWAVPVELRAEPFARGPRVDLDPVDVGNDPSTGGMVVTLPEIDGDAPAPISVMVQADDWDISAPMLASSATAQPWAAPLISWDWSFPGLAKTDHGSYISGGYYAAADNAGTLAVTPPFAGRYKTLVRAGFSDAATSFDLNFGDGDVRITQRALGNDASDPWMWWGAVGTQGWIDMGVLTLGGGWSPKLAPVLDTELRLSVSRRQGDGTIRIDTALFIPVDDDDGVVDGRTLKTDPQVLPEGPRRFYADVDRHELAMAYNPPGGGGPYPYVIAGLSGRFPHAIPGRQNVLHVIRNVDTGEDTKSDVSKITASYHPRRLYPLGP